MNRHRAPSRARATRARRPPRMPLTSGSRHFLMTTLPQPANTTPVHVLLLLDARSVAKPAGCGLGREGITTPRCDPGKVPRLMLPIVTSTASALQARLCPAKSKEASVSCFLPGGDRRRGAVSGDGRRADLREQRCPGTFSASVQIKTASGPISATIQIRIRRYTPDFDRTALRGRASAWRVRVVRDGVAQGPRGRNGGGRRRPVHDSPGPRTQDRQGPDDRGRHRQARVLRERRAPGYPAAVPDTKRP